MSKELNAKLIAVATTVSENWKELNHYEWDKELKKIEELFTQGASADHLVEGVTALEYALRFKPRVLELFAKNSADINARDENGETVLHKATTAGAAVSAQVLISFGADVRVANNERKTPIHYSTGNRDTDMFLGLMWKGCDSEVLDMCDEYGFAALHYVAQNGNSAVMKELLNAGCEVEVCDLYDRTALHHVALNNNFDGIGILMEGGIDPNLEDQFGKTALQYAAENGFGEIVNQIISETIVW